MHQLVYISTARDVGDARLADILERSRRNNRRDGITGLLLYNGTRFLQALEGDEPALDRTFDRIRTDPAHRATVVLSAKPIERRQFGHWDMACERIAGAALRETLIERVDRLVADVDDASLRAQFASYVRLKAAA